MLLYASDAAEMGVKLPKEQGSAAKQKTVTGGDVEKSFSCWSCGWMLAGGETCVPR